MADEILGFRVTIQSPEGQAAEDSSWEMWQGGGESIKECKPSRDTYKPGDPGCGEVVLQGPMLTHTRAALCQWINDTVSGKPWKRTLTVTELVNVAGAVQDGKQYIYYDCFPVGYVFPRMSVTQTTGNVKEEIRIKPIRCELK